MSNKQVIFKLGDEEYGMDILVVDAITGYSEIVDVPDSPEYILGILNLRGDVIPVYSLRRKFGMPEIEATDKTQLLITKTKDGAMVGFKVDSVSEIIEFSREELHEVPVIVKSEDTSYAARVAKKGEQLVVLLDNEKILSERESEIGKKVSGNQ